MSQEQQWRKECADQFRQLAVLVESGQVRIDSYNLTINVGGWQTLTLEISGSPQGFASADFNMQKLLINGMA